MKQFFVLFINVLLGISSFSQPAADKLSASINEGKFVFNNAVITNGWNYAPVKGVMESDGRKREGTNITHSYDEHGIVVFEKSADGQPTGIISEFQFFFSPGDVNAVTPSAFYSGSLVIDKLEISRALTPVVMKSKLVNYKLTNSYLTNSYRMAYKGIYIYFQFDKDESRLVKVSIGLDKNADKPTDAAIAPASANNSSAKKLSASVKEGKFSFNNKEISKNWSLAPITGIFGSGGRKRDGVNITHSYDDDGFVAFEKSKDKTPSGIVSECQFYFSLEDVNAVSPESMYTGKLTIEGLEITHDLTPDIIRAGLHNYSESESYMPHNFRLAYKGIYLYFQFNEDEDELQKVSIGKDERGN